jgi:PD-(D/E)XK endonuclease
VRRFYYADEIDAYAVYCPDTNRCYYLDVEDFGGRNCVFLRLDPTRNNQGTV